MPDTPDDATGDDGPDYRQLSVVALAALAIALAAFLAPAGGGITSPDADFDSDRERDGEVDPESMDVDDPSEREPGGPDNVPEIDIRWIELLEWFEFDWFDSDEPEPEPQPEPEPGEPSSTASCMVWLDAEPTPGREVTATIRHEGEPITGAPVYYNDEFVGETDEEGQVTGEVPYVEELVVRIEAEDYPACAAVEDTTSAMAATGAAGSIGTASAVGAGAGAIAMSTSSAARSIDSAPAIAGAGASTQEVGEAEDGTVEYEVEGEVEIGIRGRPDPGETVVVEASIENVPMTNASVTVDGDEVAETDADGTAPVEVPDDGSESFELGVARGDFSGTATVEVRLLEASLSPEGLAPIPGSPGVVEATIGDDPVADAEVRVGGEVVGTTDEEGRLEIALPADPTTAITVSADDRSETVSLAGVYGPIATVLGLGVVGLTVVAARTHGRRGAAAVLGATAALLAVLVVEAFYGPAAGGLVLLAFVLIAAGAVYLRGDRTIVDERPSTAGVFEWLVDRILALVALLERWVDRLRPQIAAARARLSSLPRSGTALAAAFRDWLAALPARAAAAARRGLEALRSVPTTAAVAAVASGAALATGYVVDGARGAAVVAVALGIAGLLYWRRDGDEEAEPDASDGDADENDADESVTSEPTAETDERLTFRELWRAFARRVAPRRWRTYTPGEVRRSALEQGYPDRPVDELTTLFREVEYGRRPLSRGVRDRADAAYTELVELGEGNDDPADADSSRDESPEEPTETDAHAVDTAESSPPRDGETAVDSASDDPSPGREAGGETR